MATEARNPRSSNLDKLTAIEIVRLMNDEEATVLTVLKQAEAAIAVVIERAAQAFQDGGRIVYVGAGTSGRVATMDAAEMPPTFGIEANRFIAVIAGGSAAGVGAIEDAEDDMAAGIRAMDAAQLSRKDIVIGIAASGTTPYVVSAVRHSREKGVWTCGIANNKNTALLKSADHAVLLDTGAEILTGSTRLKAGTAQKLALNRISTGAMVLSGKVIENLMVDVKANNTKLKDRCARIVCELSNSTRDEAVELLESTNWNIRAALATLA